MGKLVGGIFMIIASLVLLPLAALFYVGLRDADPRTTSVPPLTFDVLIGFGGFALAAKSIAAMVARSRARHDRT